jgi:hypothetical protein
MDANVSNFIYQTKRSFVMNNVLALQLLDTDQPEDLACPLCLSMASSSETGTVGV